MEMPINTETIQYLKKFNIKLYEKLKERGWEDHDFPLVNKIIIEKVDITVKKE